jgi:hypothetical protein
MVLYFKRQESLMWLHVLKFEDFGLEVVELVLRVLVGLSG